MATNCKDVVMSSIETARLQDIILPANRKSVLADSEREVPEAHDALVMLPGCHRPHITTIDSTLKHNYSHAASRTEDCETLDDAIAHGSPTRTNISEEKEPLASTCCPKDETRLKELLYGLKPAAQVEWETLWYYGIDASIQDIAQQYPELSLKSTSTKPSQSISEPQLRISELTNEEQQRFRQEESFSRRSFKPKSETERQSRLLRARGASNERERFALLLGFPTYVEYITQKRLKLDSAVKFNPAQLSKSQSKRQTRIAADKNRRRLTKETYRVAPQQICTVPNNDEGYCSATCENKRQRGTSAKATGARRSGMSHENSQAASTLQPAQHRPLVVGLTKPQSIRSASTMASPSDAAALNKEIEQNVRENVTEAAPSEDNPTAPAPKQKKEKAPKQPKPQKAAAVVAPTSPALIDLRVGHILRAIAHPNADSLYVSTIAMGDPEGTEHTSVDEQTGKVVRTVCSGLNGLVPLEEMQNRKIIVVANLKPVNMRSIKSAAMVLAASPKQPEGADPHAPDRVVELVMPPEGAEAGDKVYFEGWPYGDGKGPEKQLNPKKKQWEAIQPGFFTGEDLVVGFNAAECPEVEGDAKGNLVVEGKGVCTVKTLKGAVVR